LEEFVIRDDEYLYDQRFGLASLIDRAQVRLINPTSCLQKLYESLNTLDLTNDERLRPNWDQYFMRLASLAAQRSNCRRDVWDVFWCVKRESLARVTAVRRVTSKTATKEVARDAMAVKKEV